MTEFSRDITTNPVDNLKRAADLIGKSFIYATTPEGEAYWLDITKKLRSMAEAAVRDGFPTLEQTEYKDTYRTSVSPVDTKPLKLIHILYQGQAWCNDVKNSPRTWPIGHEWVYVTDADKATCNACKVALKKMGVIGA